MHPSREDIYRKTLSELGVVYKRVDIVMRCQGEKRKVNLRCKHGSVKELTYLFRNIFI